MLIDEALTPAQRLEIERHAGIEAARALESAVAREQASGPLALDANATACKTALTRAQEAARELVSALDGLPPSARVAVRLRARERTGDGAGWLAEAEQMVADIGEIVASATSSFKPKSGRPRAAAADRLAKRLLSAWLAANNGTRPAIHEGAPIVMALDVAMKSAGINACPVKAMRRALDATDGG